MAITLPNTVTTDYTLKTITDSSSNTSIAATLPSSRTVGEGMLAFLCSTRNALSDITGVPTGWQLEAKRATGSTTFPFVWIYSKIVDGTEDGSAGAAVFTWSGGTPADTGDDVCLIRMVRGNVDTSDMVGAISAIATGTSVSPASAAVTTTQASSIVMYLVCAVNGNRITAANSNNPSGSTNLISGASRAFSVGQVYGEAYVAVPSSGTSIGGEVWTGFLNNAGTNWAALSLELKSSSNAISNVNGGAGVKVGSTGNTIVFTSSYSLTGLTVGSVSATNIAGAGTSWTFDLPAQTDNTTSQNYGSKTVTATNGSTPLTTTANYLPPNGYTYVTLVDPIDTTINGIVYNFSPAAVATDQIAYRTPETSVSVNGVATTTISGSQTFYHWSSTTGKIYSCTLITGVIASILQGVILSIRALTARALTARKAA